MPLVLLLLFAFALQAQPWDTPVKLWPHASVVGAGTVTVNWAQPMPPRMLYDAADVQVLASGVEITAYVASIHDHRVLPPVEMRGLNVPAVDDLEPGIKAVHIQVERSFATAATVELTVRVGAARTLNQATLFSAIADTYVASNIVPPCVDPTFKDGDQCASIREPRVAVTHEPRWMAVANLVAFASPMGYTPTSGIDAAQINWFGSQTNKNWNPTQEALGQLVAADLTTPCTDGTVRYIRDGASATDTTTGGGDFWVEATCAVGGGSWTGANGINGWLKIVGDPDTGLGAQHSDLWQYDRATQLFWIPYIRTGSPHFLRQAIKETLLYESLLWAGEGRIESTGFFAPQNVDPMEFLDPKYSLTQPFAMLRYLYGDYRQDAVEDVEFAHRVTKPHMLAADDASSTVTTRDVANAAHSLAYAYEMTGSSATLTALQNGLTAMAAALVDGNPSVDALNRGCHHFFDSGQKFSSWKMAMWPISLAEVYRVTADASIPAMITTSMDCLRTRLIVQNCGNCGFQFSANHVVATDPTASTMVADPPLVADISRDEEHAFDVAGAIAMGHYFDGAAASRTAAENLLETGLGAFAHWTRPSGWPANGLQKYRTSPVRRNGWWFRAGYALPWLLYGPPDFNGPRHGGSAAASDAMLPPDPLTITSSSTLPGAVVSSAYSVQLQASGGVPPYSWTLTAGALPTGLTVSSSGLISGTPTTEETTTPTIDVADDDSGADSQQFSITVTASPVMSFTTLTRDDLGVASLLDQWKADLGAQSGTVCGLTVLDWNQDGWLDLTGSGHTAQGQPGIILKAQTGGVTFLGGLADSGIPAATSLAICDWGPFAWDINGDGFIDLVGHSNEQSTVPTWLNQSDGTFLQAVGHPGGITNYHFFDITADGYPRGKAARRATALQPGSSTLATSGTAVTGTGTSFLTTLLPGDGIMFRCAEADDVLRSVISTASDTSLTMDEALATEVSGCPWTAKTTDENAVWWDAIEGEIASTATRGIPIALVPPSQVAVVYKSFRDNTSGTGDLNWYYAERDAAGKLIDLNGDGLPDAVISIRGHSGSATGTSFGICINQNDGTCAVENVARGLSLRGHLQGSMITDMDGDGDQDLLVLAVGTGQSTAGVFLNDGSGNFTRVASDLSTELNSTVYQNLYVFADLDNDGDLDFVFYKSRQNNAKVYENVGAGVFTKRLDIGVWAYEPASQLTYDVDRDGLLDVMLDGPGRGGANPIDITLYRNVTSGAGNYCKVNLRQPGTPNPFALTTTFEWWPAGTRVAAGPPKWALSPPWNGEPIHVGLGAGVALDYRITWPDGAVQTADSVACEATSITVNKS